MKTTVKPLKGKIFSYSVIRKLPVGACVSDPQIQHQMWLENLTGLNPSSEGIGGQNNVNDCNKLQLMRNRMGD